jgi:hypothetical protein
MDNVGSAAFVAVAGALGILVLLLLQVTGHWPGGRPSFGPFQSTLLAVSLVGAGLIYASMLGVADWGAGELGIVLAVAACGVSAGAAWERTHAVSQWRWPWQRQRERGK